MITIKDYADSRGVSVQAVYQVIKKHKKKLSKHMIKRGRTSFLLPQAENILDNIRNISKVVLLKKTQEKDSGETRQNTIIDPVYPENEKELLKKLIEQSEKIIELNDWKASNAILIAEAHTNRAFLEEKSKELEQYKEKCNTLEKDLEALKESLNSEKRKTWWDKLLGK